MRFVPRATGVAAIILGVGLGSFALLNGAQAQANPTLSITSPANGAAATNPVSVTVNLTGVPNIKAVAAGDPNSSHLHYFVDKNPSGIVQQGQAIPSGDPQIIHSGETTQALPTLAPGLHTVWVVLGHFDHTPYNPNVQATVTFTVGASAQASPAAGAPRAATPAAAAALPATGDNLSTARLLAVLVAVVLVVGGYSAIRYSYRKR